MDTISVKEKNAVFKAAEEQLAARTLAAGIDEPNANLITRTFRKLDIEAIAPKDIGKLESEAKEIRKLMAWDHAKSTTENLERRGLPRKKLKASLDLRI